MTHLHMRPHEALHFDTLRSYARHSEEAIDDGNAAPAAYPPSLVSRKLETWLRCTSPAYCRPSLLRLPDAGSAGGPLTAQIVAPEGGKP
jgi:hypothetical protein